MSSVENLSKKSGCENKELKKFIKQEALLSVSQLVGGSQSCVTSNASQAVEHYIIIRSVRL